MAHAGLFGVGAHGQRKRRRADAQLARLKPGPQPRARQQVVARDADLFGFGVALELDNFEAVDERLRNAVDVDGGRDKQATRQVERNAEVTIEE